jgi:hypothetical protein
MILRRRQFLKTAAGWPFAAALSEVPARADSKAKSCILFVLNGGPSQVDTWDMKPDAPTGIRGPFRPIHTNVPGIEISEIFPRMARHADKYALVRSVYSDAAPAHDDGLHLIDQASDGCVVLPGPIGFMGGIMPPSGNHRRFGSLAENCLRARQLVEAGVPFIRVNMHETIFHRATWDSHGTRPFSTISDYRNIVGPTFDAAYSSLLEDLHQRGLLESTLVVAMGEFGRTPRINPSGGRDHWTKCWTVLLAGGGVRGGQVYGSSDATGAEPKDNPVEVARIFATMSELRGARTGHEPIRELFI